MGLAGNACRYRFPQRVLQRGVVDRLCLEAARKKREAGCRNQQADERAHHSSLTSIRKAEPKRMLAAFAAARLTVICGCEPPVMATTHRAACTQARSDVMVNMEPWLATAATSC